MSRTLSFRYYLLLTLLLLVLPSSAKAQTAGSSDGLDFFISYIRPTLGDNRASIGLFALVSAYHAADVTISYFDPNGVEQVAQTISVKAHTTSQVSLNPNLIFALFDSQPVYAACRIHAKTPISVQVYSEGTNGAELYLALPRTVLGTKYVVASYANNAPMTKDPESRSVFQVIATKPNTKVHIKLTALTTYPLPDTIIMQRGEVLRVRAAGAFVYDLTGSIITSSLPVAVISGHEGAALPGLQGYKNWESKLDDAQNMLIEQMLPVKDWKLSDYYSLPFLPDIYESVPRDTGDMLRVLGADTTGGFTRSVSSPLRFDTLWQGAYFENAYQDYPEVLTSLDARPESVFQYDYYQGKTGGSGETFGYTVPVMMTIIPRENWKQEYIWGVPANSDYRGGQRLSMIYDISSPPRIELDGNVLQWTQRARTALAIPGHPELIGVTFNISPGSYYASGTKPFVIYSYGHSEGNYKINAGYAAPCGTLAIEEKPVSKLSFDSTCGSWSGVFIDSQAVAGDGTEVIAYSDSSILKHQQVKLLRNMSIAVDSLSEKSWGFRLRVTDRLKDADGYLYLSDQDGIHLLHTFHYAAPTLQVISSVNLKRIEIGIDTCTNLTLVNTSDSVAYSIDNWSGLKTPSNFRVSSTTPALPTVLRPHDTLRVRICASSSIPDSTFRDTLTLSSDCYSLTYPLSLFGIAPRVNWLEHDTTATLVCGSADTVRLWLVNDNPHDGSEVIYDIRLQGADASEFAIVANQLGYFSLKNFPLDPGERVWFDVAFRPDMSKLPPYKWADRNANIVELSSLNTAREVLLTAHLTHPALAVNRGNIDLGHVRVPAYGQQSLTLSDTGDAPLIIRSFKIGNPKISISGITIGDTILPGQSVTVTITGTSTSADSIFTELTLDALEECANPIVIPISFFPYVPLYHGPHLTTTDLSLQPQYICTRTGVAGSIRNDGSDTLTLRQIDIIGTPEITFTDGNQSQLFNVRMVPDTSIVFNLTLRLSSQGLATAIIRYTWDSAGSTAYSYSTIGVTGIAATTTIAVNAPTALGDNTPGSEIAIPITLAQSLPKQLGVTKATLKFRYRRDLFRVETISSSYLQPTPFAQSDDGNGNQIVVVSLTSSAGFSAGEIVKLKLKLLVAVDTASELEVLESTFFGPTDADTLCVDYNTIASRFSIVDLCSDGLLRKALNGRSPFWIESISPNPTASALTVHLIAELSGSLYLELHDEVGRKCFNERYEVTKGRSDITINAPSLPSGNYTLTLASEFSIVTRRIEIVR